MLYIVLVNYNSTQDTITCIDSIIKSNHCGICSIKIFDNNSEHKEKEILQKYISTLKQTEYVKNVECFFHNKNIGFAAGNNYWLRRIPKDEYVWFLNNDTKTNKKLFEQVFKSLPNSKSAIYFDCRNFQGVFHDDGMHYVNLLTGKYHTVRKTVFDFGYICGASILLKNSNNTPLWNEEYFLYFEDSDYGMRLKQQGIKFMHIQDCYFEHKISATTQKSSAINYIKLHSQVIFMKKYGLCFPLFFIGKFFYLFLVKKDINGAKKLFSYALKVKAGEK